MKKRKHISEKETRKKITYVQPNFLYHLMHKWTEGTFLADQFPDPNNKVNDLIHKLTNVHIEQDGMMLSFRDDSTSGTWIASNHQRINNLFKLRKEYHKEERTEEEVINEIYNIYSSSPHFILQIRMENKFPGYTPGLGFCWLIAEWQAYYRGLQDPESSADSWQSYYKHDNLESILEEAYNLMLVQQHSNYEEANRIEDKKSVEELHKIFINQWEDQEKKGALIVSGTYEKEGWGKHTGFGTLFFSGKGSLNKSPPLNYFIDNAAINLGYSGRFLLNGYARLCLVLPLTPEHEDNSCLPYTKFSIANLKSALGHNNNIIYSQTHFQPIDWPKDVKEKEKRLNILNNMFENLIFQTAHILLKYELDDNLIDDEYVEKYCLKTIKDNI